MKAVIEVPPPVRIPVSPAWGYSESRRLRWLCFWVAMVLAFGGVGLAIYLSGPHTQDREALALLPALLAILALFPTILSLNTLLDWRRDQAYVAARKFGELESPLEPDNGQAMSRLRLVLQRTGQLRVAPQFIGTTGDRSYLVISANARQTGNSRRDWVLEVDDEVTVLMAHDASVASIEQMFPALVYRQAT